MPYPVCVHQDGNGSLGAVIPDFPGCFSGADDWRTLPRMVQEAIKVYCEGEDLEIPAPSSLDPGLFIPYTVHRGITSQLIDLKMIFRPTSQNRNFLAAIASICGTKG